MEDEQLEKQEIHPLYPVYPLLADEGEVQSRVGGASSCQRNGEGGPGEGRREKGDERRRRSRVGVNIKIATERDADHNCHHREAINWNEFFFFLIIKYPDGDVGSVLLSLSLSLSLFVRSPLPPRSFRTSATGSVLPLSRLNHRERHHSPPPSPPFRLNLSSNPKPASPVCLSVWTCCQLQPYKHFTTTTTSTSCISTVSR